MEVAEAYYETLTQVCPGSVRRARKTSGKPISWCIITPWTSIIRIKRAKDIIVVFGVVVKVTLKFLFRLIKHQAIKTYEELRYSSMYS
jgi:hypothetical protein